MKLKKILAVLSSAALMSTLTAQVASAVEVSETEGTYKYVALGDSIGSGYGLETTQAGNMASDRALIINQELLDNPVKGAFPAVFGKWLDEEVLSDYDWSAETTNLCATAYRAEDVAKVLKNEDYIGGIAKYFIGGSEKNNADLKAYHEIFNEYVSDADLVSIELGGDDMLMATIWPMFVPEEGQKANPVLQAMAMGMLLTLLGNDVEVAFGAAAGVIMKAQENGEITPEVLAEAAEYMQSVAQNADKIADEAANFVAETVDTVRDIAENDPDIAILSMFNPYNTPDEKEKLQLWNQQTADVAQALYAKASEEYTGRVIDSVATYKAGAGYVPAPTLATQQFNADVNDLQGLIDSLDDESKEQIKEILNRLADEIALPMLQMMAGETVDPQIKLLNSKLKAIADSKGCVYVDTYGIPSDGDFDPHPDAAGHKAIAERMENALEKTVRARFGDIIEDPDPVDPEPVDVDGEYEFAEDEITIKTGSTKQLVIYDENGNKANGLDGWKFYTFDENVVAVDENTGMIKALKAGKATVYAENVYDPDGRRIECTVNVVSVFPPAYVPSGTVPTTDAVARDKVTGFVNTVADSSSAGPIAATGGEFGSEENDTPAVVAASILGVIALGFVVVSRKRRHS